jgi:hypothetical protein
MLMGALGHGIADRSAWRVDIVDEKDRVVLILPFRRFRRAADRVKAKMHW